MFNELTPKKGSLLISEPFMLDPNFERAVLLLCDHNEEGTLGFVLNHKIENTVGEIIKEIESCDFPIYLGGPVAQNELFFIHKKFELLQSGEEIVKDVFFGGEASRLFDMINAGLIQENEIKFFVG